MTNLDGVQPNQGKGNNSITAGTTKSFAIAPNVSTVPLQQFKNFQAVINGSVIGGTLNVAPVFQRFFDIPPTFAPKTQLDFVRLNFQNMG